MGPRETALRSAAAARARAETFARALDEAHAHEATSDAAIRGLQAELQSALLMMLLHELRSTPAPTYG